jgi:hypothetical protein
VCPVNAILLNYGSEAQKQQWLVPLAKGEMLGAFCLTEPHVGSDAAALRTTATRDGDHYVLNGVKQFITSGKHADVAIVMAVTDKAAGKRGISAFLVPTDTPGYVVARLEDKLGQQAVSLIGNVRTLDPGNPKLGALSALHHQVLRKYERNAQGRPARPGQKSAPAAAPAVCR